MRYVGLDSHWRQSTICVLDHRGRKLLNRTIKGSWSKVLEEVGKVRKPVSPDPIAVTTGRCRIELCPSSAPV